MRVNETKEKHEVSRGFFLLLLLRNECLETGHERTNVK
jgi:hypothetical protein